jgi:hypothetical protein
MNDHKEDDDDAYGTAGCQPECLLTKENREDDGTSQLFSPLLSTCEKRKLRKTYEKDFVEPYL